MLTFRRKRQLKLAQRRVLIDSIKIGLASPIQIQKWAERELPNGKKIGRVTNPKTVDYKTLKPVKDGLFCERIFGPVKDFVCACGKRQGGGKGRFCTECEVEWTSCRTRRYRLGYIDLASPVTHVWYIKGRPNYIATLLGEKQRLVEAIAYCTKFVLGEAALNDSGGIRRPTSEKRGAEIVNEREGVDPLLSQREGVGVSPETLYGAWETAHLPKELQTSAPADETSGFANNSLHEDLNTTSIPLNRSNNILPVLSYRTLSSNSLPIFAVQRSSESLGLDNPFTGSKEVTLPGFTLAVPGETNLLSIVPASSIRNYSKEFSKRVPISKTLCTEKSLSHFSVSCIQFQSVSDTTLWEKVFLPLKKGKGDCSLTTFYKRPKRSRGTTYLYQSRNFASKDMANGARGALKPKAWKGSQVVKDWRENQPYNGLAPVGGGSLATPLLPSAREEGFINVIDEGQRGEAPRSLRSQGLYPSLTISDSFTESKEVTYNIQHTAHNSRFQEKSTDFLPFAYPSLKQSPHNKPSWSQDLSHIGIYSKKQTIPLSFAFAREPDERSQLLEFLHSPVTTGDFAIPVYSASVMSGFSVSKTRSAQDASRVFKNAYTLYPQTINQPWVNALGLTHLNSRIVSKSWQIESFKDRQLFLLHTNLETSYSKTPTLGRKAIESPFLFPTSPSSSITLMLNKTAPSAMKAGGSLATPLLPSAREEGFINVIDEDQRGGGQQTPGNDNRKDTSLPSVKEYFTDPAASSTPSGQSEETLRNVKSVRDDGSWFTLAPEGAEPIGSLSARNGEVASSGPNSTFQNQNKAKLSWDSGSLPLQARLIGSIRDGEALQMVRRGPLGPRFLLSDLEKKIKDPLGSLRGPEPNGPLNAQVSQPIDPSLYERRGDPGEGKTFATKVPTGPSLPFPTQKVVDLSRVTEIRQKLSYTGGEALKTLLNQYNITSLLRYLEYEIRELESEINELAHLASPLRSQHTRLRKLRSWRAKQVRRLKVAKLFLQTNKQPEWMMLSKLPVLPPELRPIVRLDGGVVVVADLNKLYQKVIFRNNRLEALRMVDLSSVGQAKRLLQEAVDGLLDNGKGGAIPLSGPNDRPLKSLSDGLKGKRGRFRQNLLGKRVDYSGRSVIVVGPDLELHQCGLPREIAIELFQPFVSRQLKERGVAENINASKRFMKQNHPILWEVLQQLMQQHPVLLNRAPTLHRLGIQAFQPKLVHGRAILLHPLVCTAFNADFDGDQMAVHLPLSFQSQGEAWKLLWSRNNLLSPATGQPILVPSQDMVLGCYYLTTLNHRAAAISPYKSRKPLGQGMELMSENAVEQKPKDPFTPKTVNGTGSVTSKVTSLLSVKDTSLLSVKEVKDLGADGKLQTPIESSTASASYYFNTLSETAELYQQGNLSLHQPVWVRCHDIFETGNLQDEPLEIRLHTTGRGKTISCGQQFDIVCLFNKDDQSTTLGEPPNQSYHVSNQYIRTTAGRALVNDHLNLSCLE